MDEFRLGHVIVCPAKIGDKLLSHLLPVLIPLAEQLVVVALVTLREVTG